MARKKLTQKLTGFPLFHKQTNGFTFPLTHSFTKDFVGLDDLSLDLQFATDKTLTARKGPTPTFTRASSATQVGATGLIEYAPENLYIYSEAFSNANWNKTRSSVIADATTAPDGTLTADKLVEDSSVSDTHTIGLSTIARESDVHTLSIFAKKGERDFIVLRSRGINYFFDLNTGVAITAGGTITDHGNGWYRCEVTTGTGVQSSFHMSADGITTTYTGDGISGIFVWGAQLERHTSARTYIPTTTAAVYGARFDHDPVTLACKGLLIEESRTNLVTQSENFGTTWAVNNALTVTSNSVTAPDGTLTADSLNFDTDATSRILQFAGSNIVSTFSVWLRADAPTTCRITTAAAGSAPNEITVSVTTEWQRFSVVATTWVTGTASFNVRIANNTNGTSGTIYAWGAQLEAGSFPTSYIPTTTASVVRSADVCSITGSDFTGFYNQSEGTIITSASVPVLIGNNRGLFGINNNTASHGFLTFYNSSSSGVLTQSRNAPAAATTLPPATFITEGFLFKRALAYYPDSGSISSDGSLVTTTAATMSTQTMLTLQIGSMLAGSFYWSGHIASLRYYKKRLSNQKLQTLTT